MGLYGVLKVLIGFNGILYHRIRISCRLSVILPDIFVRNNALIRVFESRDSPEVDPI